MALDLLNLSNQLAETVNHAAASIVTVHARRGIGCSGISWRENLILTSSEGLRVEEGIKILLPDGTVTPARLRGRDSATDLAVLETEGVSLRSLEFAGVNALQPGQLAIAVGRTSNTGPIASFGIISGVAGEWKTWRGGRIDPFVRLDITAYPTLSGGAALDADGHLIGMVSTGLSRSSVFALTRSTIDRIAGRLIEQGYVSRGFLGAAVQPVMLPGEGKDHPPKDTPVKETGLIVVAIDPDGPAAAGKMMLGDVLLSANVGGQVQPLPQPEALADLLERTPAGGNVSFQILRAGAVQDLTVRIGERPSRRR